MAICAPHLAFAPRSRAFVPSRALARSVSLFILIRIPYVIDELRLKTVALIALTTPSLFGE